MFTTPNAIKEKNCVVMLYNKVLIVFLVSEFLISVNIDINVPSNLQSPSSFIYPSLHLQTHNVCNIL